MIFLNEQELKKIAFPNGETNFDFSNVHEEIAQASGITLEMVFQGNDDLIDLMFVKGYIDNNKSVSTKVALVLAYMPYSRMDRVEDQKYAFTLKLVSNFINSLNFDIIAISEPHSDVCVALLDRVRVQHTSVYLLDEVMEKIKMHGDHGKVAILYPDAGAHKRYAKTVKYDVPQLFASKTRDFKTGKITGVSIPEIPNETKLVIILDDLCSYGGTFLALGDEIKAVHPNMEILLIVAHCENSVYQGELLKPNSPIGMIITTNSLLIEREKNDKLQVATIITKQTKGE